MGKTTTVFIRTASGLRRDFSIFDMFLLNFMSGHWIYETLLFAGLLQVFGSFAGADLYLGMLLQGLGAIPVTITYAMLTASMPRTGGDYVWESRILHPVIAFVATMTAGIAGALLWNPWNGYNSAVIGMGSGFGLLGTSFSNDSWTNMAAWFSGIQGQYVMTAIAILMPILFLSIGLRRYAWIQKGIFVLSVIGFVVIAGTLLLSNHASFVQSFDNVAGQGTYQKIISEAQNTGLGTTTQFSLYSTIVWAAYMAVGTSWQSCAATPLAGEVKSASSVRKMLLAYAIGPLISILFGFVLFTGLFQTVGKEFMVSAGYLMQNGSSIVTNLPFPPYFIWLSALLVHGPMLIPVVILIAGGMIAMAWFANFENTMWPTRYFFAQSFDRVLPGALSYVHKRSGVPLVALGVAGAASMVWWVFASQYPNVWLFFTAATVLIFLQNFLVCLSGLVFPFRHRTAYSASPIAKYKVAGMPVICIPAVLGMIYAASFTYAFLAIPALGVLGFPPSWGMMGGILVVCAIYYYVAKWYRNKQQGIDIALAFQEVPPL